MVNDDDRVQEVIDFYDKLFFEATDIDGLKRLIDSMKRLKEEKNI